MEAVYRWFRAEKSEPRILCETGNYLDAAALAAKNVGIGLLPRAAVPPGSGLAVKNLAGEDKRTDYFFVWLKGHPLPTAEERFIDAVKACQKEGRGLNT